MEQQNTDDSKSTLIDQERLEIIKPNIFVAEEKDNEYLDAVSREAQFNAMCEHYRRDVFGQVGCDSLIINISIYHNVLS